MGCKLWSHRTITFDASRKVLAQISVSKLLMGTPDLLGQSGLLGTGLLLGHRGVGLRFLLVVGPDLFSQGIVDLVHTVERGVELLWHDVFEVTVLFGEDDNEVGEEIESRRVLASAVLLDRLEEGRELVSHKLSFGFAELILEKLRRSQ